MFSNIQEQAEEQERKEPPKKKNLDENLLPLCRQP